MKIFIVILLIIIGLIGIWLGGICFQYSWEIITGHIVKLPLAILGSVVTAEVVFPVTIILWLLVQSGIVHPPLLHG